MRSALQHEGRQYTYNTNQYRRDQRALLVRAYNLEGRVKWKQKVITVGDELMEKMKIQLLGVGRIGFSEEKGFQGSSES